VFITTGQIQGLPGRRHFQPSYYFAQRKRMQAVVVIAPLKRVSTLTVNIESCAPRHKERVFIVVFVIFPFNEPFPRPIFMDLVKSHHPGDRRPTAAHDGAPIVAIVPVQIDSRHSIEHLACERRFAYLPGARYKDHFLPEIVHNCRKQRARNRFVHTMPAINMSSKYRLNDKAFYLYIDNLSRQFMVLKVICTACFLLLESFRRKADSDSDPDSDSNLCYFCSILG
jgi:hypothetical protein